MDKPAIQYFLQGALDAEMVFSDRIQDHVARPRNRGEMPDATHIGLAGVPGDGPHVKLWFLIEDGVIRKASYDTNGCPSSIGCASMLCELCVGRAMETMKLLEPRELDVILGGLPEGKGHYAELAVKALRSTVEVV